MANVDDLLAPIRLRAYFLWQEAGEPAGGDIAFWDEARRQIEREREHRQPAGDQAV